MAWKKLGQIFCPDNNAPWMMSHASQPIPLCLDGDIIRVFFSCRDNQNRSSVGFVDFDLNRPDKVLRLSEKPMLSPGRPGTFDQDGISIGCIVPFDAEYRLYYLGWNLLKSVPWYNSIGLAISSDLNEPFVRFSEAPIFARNPIDPISFSYPWIMKDGDIWKMWYGSNLRWGPEQKDMDHVIKYAESKDGINWTPTGKICIGIEDPSEYAFSRAHVRRDGGLYKMWYSFRGKSYRIGYAESTNGTDWTRMDHRAEITTSKSGWDSEAVSYAHLFVHSGNTYMVYNGNNYAKTGFGLAVWE